MKNENKKSMQDLANMVTVRNHLYWLLTNGSKNLIKKQDVQTVIGLINSLDTDFIRSTLELAVQDKIDTVVDIDVQKRINEVKVQLKADLAKKAVEKPETKPEPKKGSFKRVSQEDISDE